MQGMLQTLPPWARAAVLAAGCVALVAGLGILGWLLRPGLPGLLARICCRRRRRNSENVTPAVGNKPRFSIDEELQLEDVTFRSWARGSLYEATPVAADGDSVSRASHRDSTYSSMSDGTDTSSIMSFASGAQVGEPPRPGPPPPGCPLGGPLVGPPSVVLVLQFRPGTAGQGASPGASSGASAGRLAVTVVEARCLPARDYGCSPDPAVQLSVAPRPRLPFRWPALLRPRAPPLAAPHWPHALHQLRTRTLRHARQPRYNEDFAVEARRTDLKDWVLHVTVMDDCKLRGSTVLCRGEVRLKQAMKQALADGAAGPTQVSVALAPQPQERGLLLFGLSFLPTAQRLNVSLIKATRVRLDHVVPSADAFRPYVRVTLVHVGSGRRVDSARTEPQEASVNPEFCETLSLKLAPAQLGTLSLVVALCHRLPDGDERPAGGPGGRRPRSRDRVVGAVAVGGRASSERGREHWRAIEQRPRRVVSIWHTLT